MIAGEAAKRTSILIKRPRVHVIRSNEMTQLKMSQKLCGKEEKRTRSGGESLPDEGRCKRDTRYGREKRVKREACQVSSQTTRPEKRVVQEIKKSLGPLIRAFSRISFVVQWNSWKVTRAEQSYTIQVTNQFREEKAASASPFVLTTTTLVVGIEFTHCFTRKMK